MKLISDSQAIVNRLLNNEYEGTNTDALKDMDLNELASNLSQLGDKMNQIQEAVNGLHSLSNAQSN